MKKVLLVYPGKPGFEKKEKIPLALLFLATTLAKNNYEARILDERIEDYRKLDYNDYLCVGITTQTGNQILDGIEVAKFIKKNNKELKIVWGGVHPTILPDSTIDNEYVDIVVRGDGELILLELVRAIKDNKPLKNIKGIVYKENGKVIRNSPAELVDLDKIDFPNHDLINLKKYSYKEAFPISTSRGCSHRCSFCCVKDKWRGRSAAKIIEDIEKIIKKYNPDVINVRDNNFFFSKERIRKFCEEKIKRNIKIKWKAQCRADYFSKYDNEFVSLLKKSGCISLLFGAESGNQRILDLLKKDIKVEDTVKSIKMCGKHGIIPVLGFIIGNITETKKEVFETLNFIDYLVKINPETEIAGIFLLTPWPGTDTFTEFKKIGLKEPKTLEEWGHFNLGDIKHNIYVLRRHRHLYKTIEMVSRFPFFKKKKLKKSPIAKGHNRLPFFKEIGYRILYNSAVLRWKYKFFYFGFEWDFYNFYVRRFGRF